MNPLGFLVNPPLFWGSKRSRISMFEQMRRASEDARSLQDFPGEHLGLASIAAYCRQQGQRIQIINGLVEEHSSIEQTFAQIEEAVRTHGVPQLIGFSGTSVVYKMTIALAKKVKEAWPEVRTILGYDFATLNYERLLTTQPSVDYVCRGDGEHLFSVLIDRIAEGRAVEDIPGLAYRGPNGAIVANDPIAVEINTLPWVARDDLPRVLAGGLGPGIYASRGCPYRCSYCALGETSALFGKDKWRLRDLEPLVEELAYLKRDFGIENITIVDDLFLTRATASRARAEQFATMLIERNIKIDWMIDCRVDSIDGPLFEHLRRAGLHKIFVGVETPDTNQLATYNKKYLIKKDRPIDRLRIARDLGITVVPGILTFHPESEPRELRAILGLVDELGWRGKYQLHNRVRPYPGTPLYDQYNRQGWLRGEWPTEHWEHADERLQQMAIRVNMESMRPNTSFDRVRAVFLRDLEALETGATITLGAIDDEARAAIDAGMESAGATED